MRLPLLSIPLQSEDDIVLARQRARAVAEAAGFDLQDQTRIATAVSEIARNAYSYASGGTAEFSIDGKTSPQVLVITIRDRGPGIENLQEILDGRYRSTTGMGLGIIGARRLVDRFEIDRGPRGTTVVMSKLLPRGAPVLAPGEMVRIAEALAHDRRSTPLEELRQQNLELVRALDDLQSRQEELVALNRELQDTNRGVVALYAELDEKAEHLRRADEMKSRFLSNMTHEFRTPLSSITALSKLLLDETDGALNEEQRRQVEFVRKAAADLTEIVNDLLDIAKIEAGKITVRPKEFSVEQLFSALRGMLRPLLMNQSLLLVFEETGDLPLLYTDEGKVSQILRNFISNALKFTEAGEVRVAARMDEKNDHIVFTVSDTGIGIAPENQELIFQEFEQIESRLQHRVRGTGLGLPLTRKLAQILGGRIELESALGKGSRFSAHIARVYATPPTTAQVQVLDDDPLIPVLVVEDHLETLLIYEKFLHHSPFRMIPARTIREAREVLKTIRPRVIVLDILLAGDDTWSFFADLRRQPETRHTPVAIVSQVEDQHKAAALGADAYRIKPASREWLLETLTQLGRPRSALVIDDDDASRYLLRRALTDVGCATLEAATAAEGLLRCRSERPDLVFLDLQLPDGSGLDVLTHLRESASTAQMPVIIYTSHPVDENLTRSIGNRASMILSKQNYDRESLVAALRQLLVEHA
jgi:signal transduction histidine kinase/DNA-binding response OmpR family regulator